MPLKPVLKTARGQGVDVYTAAVGRMVQAYEQYESVVVGFSGGKDSTAVLEIARVAARRVGRLPVQVGFLDEEVLYPETISHVQEIADDPEMQVLWLCAAATYRNACSNDDPDFVPWDPAKRDVWFRDPHPASIWPAGQEKLPATWGYSGKWVHPAQLAIELVRPGCLNVNGLRADESMGRRLGAFTRGGWLQPQSRFASPIYDWKLGDVWWAVREHGWKYNRAYDRFLRLGRSPRQIRVAPLFGSYACKALSDVKQGWPELWPKLRLRVEGVAASGNWKGELHEAKPGPDGTWKSGLQKILGELSPEDRTRYEKEIKSRLRKHEKHSTSEPLDTKQCPHCQLSWKKIAVATAAADRHGSRSLL